MFNRIITGLRKFENKRVYTIYAKNTVLIPCLEFSEMHIQATAEERQAIMDIAQEATCTFLQQPSSLKRRHSVG